MNSHWPLTKSYFVRIINYHAIIAKKHIAASNIKFYQSSNQSLRFTWLAWVGMDVNWMLVFILLKDMQGHLRTWNWICFYSTGQPKHAHQKTSNNAEVVWWTPRNPQPKVTFLACTFFVKSENMINVQYKSNTFFIKWLYSFYQKYWWTTRDCSLAICGTTTCFCLFVCFPPLFWTLPIIYQRK